MEHKWADVLRAIADGKEVQWRNMEYGTVNWQPLCDTVNPIAYPLLDWRIKPERKADVVWYINQYVNGSTGVAQKDLRSALNNRKSNEHCIGTIRVTITHDDDGNPQRGTVEWCDE